MNREIKHLFVKPETLAEKPSSLLLEDSENYHYLVNVLRFHPGNTLYLIGKECFASARLTAVHSGNHSLEFQAEKYEPVPREPFYLHLYAGLPKGDTAEQIIDQSTQLGASEITFFESEFSQIKIKDIPSKKLVRWNKIALQAARQSRRFHLPVIPPPQILDEILSSLQKEGLNILFYEEALEYSWFHSLQKPHEKISLFIGSEGGFSRQEAECFRQQGAVISRLSEQRLRTATACSAALALVHAELFRSRTTQQPAK